MLSPVQKEHELVCPGCGCVLQNVENQSNDEEITKSPVTISFNQFLLGSALVKNVKYAKPRDDRQRDEEKVLRRLLLITTDYKLPEALAFETFNHLKKKNRGFTSDTEYIKQLLKILSKDENYLHINKMRAIKARYESILNH